MRKIAIIITLFSLTSILTACGFGNASCDSCGSRSYTTVSCCNSTPW